MKEYVTRQSLGLKPIKHRKELEIQKEDFLKKCIDKESSKIQKMTGYMADAYDRFHWSHYPNSFDVRRARHNHKCFSQSCKKVIKKDQFYFRRSFGRLWTIKACSILCFLRCLP